MSPVERWAWRAIALNAGLGLVHALVAASSGSLAVAAELAHNGADLVAAVAVLIGVKLATRTTEWFPYGLHKVENLVAAGVAGLVFLTAYEIVRHALTGGGTSEVDAWMVAVVVLTTAAPLLFSHFELRVAQAESSPAPVPPQAPMTRVTEIATATGMAGSQRNSPWPPGIRTSSCSRPSWLPGWTR